MLINSDSASSGQTIKKRDIHGSPMITCFSETSCMMHLHYIWQSHCFMAGDYFWPTVTASGQLKMFWKIVTYYSICKTSVPVSSVDQSSNYQKYLLIWSSLELNGEIYTMRKTHWAQSVTTRFNPMSLNIINDECYASTTDSWPHLTLPQS